MSEDSDPEFSFKLSLVVRERTDDGTQFQDSSPVTCDVFDIRKRVFDIQHVEDAFELFREFGPWQLSESFDQGRNIRFSTLLSLRDFFADALLKRSLLEQEKIPHSDSWSREAAVEELIALYLSFPLTMNLQFGDPPHATIRCKDIQESLRASVFLDTLDGFSWRRCQREDCRKLFKLVTKREKLYCSADCAHLQSVRSYNKRKAVKAKSVKRKGG